MAAEDKLSEVQKPLLAPLKEHPDWGSMMNKEIAQLVLDGKAEPREAADFLLARFVRKVA